jgi:hypothetical protein
MDQGNSGGSYAFYFTQAECDNSAAVLVLSVIFDSEVTASDYAEPNIPWLNFIILNTFSCQAGQSSVWFADASLSVDPDAECQIPDITYQVFGELNGNGAFHANEYDEHCGEATHVEINQNPNGIVTIYVWFVTSEGYTIFRTAIAWII